MTDADMGEPVVLGELATSTGFLLRMAQLRAFENFFARLDPLGVKPGEFTVLWVIGQNPGLRQGSIARELRIKPAHMTKLVRRLVESGHVARHTPAGDRRSVLLTLTPAGETFVAAHRGALLGLHDADLGYLTADEARQFVALLRKFTGMEGLSCTPTTLSRSTSTPMPRSRASIRATTAMTRFRRGWRNTSRTPRARTACCRRSRTPQPISVRGGSVR